VAIEGPPASPVLGTRNQVALKASNTKRTEALRRSKSKYCCNYDRARTDIRRRIDGPVIDPSPHVLRLIGIQSGRKEECRSTSACSSQTDASGRRTG
jgi:hypothetical protein